MTTGVVTVECGVNGNDRGFRFERDGVDGIAAVVAIPILPA